MSIQAKQETLITLRYTRAKSLLTWVNASYRLQYFMGAVSTLSHIVLQDRCQQGELWVLVGTSLKPRGSKLSLLYNHTQRNPCEVPKVLSTSAIYALTLNSYLWTLVIISILSTSYPYTYCI